MIYDRYLDLPADTALADYSDSAEFTYGIIFPVNNADCDIHRLRMWVQFEKNSKVVTGYYLFCSNEIINGVRDMYEILSSFDNKKLFFIKQCDKNTSAQYFSACVKASFLVREIIDKYYPDLSIDYSNSYTYDVKYSVKDFSCNLCKDNVSQDFSAYFE